jgi:hypothetical protein
MHIEASLACVNRVRCSQSLNRATAFPIVLCLFFTITCWRPPKFVCAVPRCYSSRRPERRIGIVNHAGENQNAPQLFFSVCFYF